MTNLNNVCEVAENSYIKLETVHNLAQFVMICLEKLKSKIKDNVLLENNYTGHQKKLRRLVKVIGLLG